MTFTWYIGEKNQIFFDKIDCIELNFKWIHTMNIKR